MTIQERIESFHKLGEEIRNYLAGNNAGKTTSNSWDNAIKLAGVENGWFTQENILYALKQISEWLERPVLTTWIKNYNLTALNENPQSIGIIMAGNIPLVGFHDLLCVLMTGNILHAKLSHTDSALMKLVVNRLIEIEPRWDNMIILTDSAKGGNSPALSFKSLDAIIATGSNNSAKHFEYYFKDVPHIIRKNRNSIAALTGTESTEELTSLGEDIFHYFGLGCRNVSKLYVPQGYDFTAFFRSIEKYGAVINNSKYANNYLYNRTLYLMNGDVFTDNNFLLLKESSSVASPCAVIHFEYYARLTELANRLNAISDNIQCVVTAKDLGIVLKEHLNEGLSGSLIRFGETQSPSLSAYADGVDTIQFLLNLPKQLEHLNRKTKKV